MGGVRGHKLILGYFKVYFPAVLKGGSSGTGGPMCGLCPRDAGWSCEPGGIVACAAVMRIRSPFPPSLGPRGQPGTGTGPGTGDAFAKAPRLWGMCVSSTGSPPAHGQGHAGARGGRGERCRPLIRTHRPPCVEAVAELSLRCHWDTRAVARPQIYRFWLKTD